MLRLCLLITLTAALTACADFPDPDGTRTGRAGPPDYPLLQPLDQLLARAAIGDGRDLQAGAEQLVARAAGLRDRAARLRRPVLTAGERRRMAAAVARHTS